VEHILEKAGLLRIGVACDDYKIPYYEKYFKEAELEYEVAKGTLPGGAKLITVWTACPIMVNGAIVKANIELKQDMADSENKPRH